MRARWPDAMAVRATTKVTPAMQRGTDLEPAARAAYEDQTSLVMQPLVLEDGAYSARLDGMTLPGDLILEIKCPIRGARSDLWQDVAAGKVPENYMVQIQHQLMVSGAETAHLWREEIRVSIVKYVLGGTVGINKPYR